VQAGVQDPAAPQNAILRALDVNYAVLDANGFIVEVSSSWSEFTSGHCTLADAPGIGANYLDVCRRSIPNAPDAQQILNGLRAVMNGSEPGFRYQYPCNCQCQTRWFVMTALPHPGLAGHTIVAHYGELRVAGSQLCVGDLLDSVGAIIWRGEFPSFRTTFVSKQVEAILGFSAAAWVADQELWGKQLHPDDRDRVYREAFQGATSGQRYMLEYRLADAHGQYKWMRNTIMPIVRDGEIKEQVGVATDVTDLKKALEERNRLAERLLRSQESERSAVARELHDDIGQTLTVFDLSLQSLYQNSAPDSPLASELLELHSLAQSLARDVQRLSHGLHSACLDLLGLGKAAAQLCREYAQRGSEELSVEIDDIPLQLDKEIAISIFRVLQECLRNINKHSHASHAWVSLAADSDCIRLSVSDDGVGFDPAENSHHGLGLTSMAERIRILEGTLGISSSPGHGTRIIATVPLRDSTELCSSYPSASHCDE
jgi:PAS domain S-box-containing protein